MNSQYDQLTLFVSGAGFVGALVAIHKGYQQSWSNVVSCSTVWSLITLALLASLSTSSVDAYLNPKPEWKAPTSWEDFLTTVIEQSNSYVELVAFVPAVWIVYREDRSVSRFTLGSAETKRTATAFFLFLVGFYVFEDLLMVYQAYDFSVLASLAHLAHFMLLLDFSCYLLAHIYNPDKLVGDLR